MISNQDIICVSNTTWYGEYTKSTVQLMARLAKKNRVVFIEYPYTLKDLLLAMLGKKEAPVKRILGLAKRLISIQSDVDTPVYNLVMPPVLPVYFIKNSKLFQFVMSVNAWIYRRYLKKMSKKLQMDKPIIVNAYNPFYGTPLMGKLNQALDVYYCYDGYDVNRYGNRVVAVDNKFSASADAVITTSDYLKQDKLQFTKKSFVVKNGVDYNTFVAHLKSDIHHRSDRVVGYIGSLDQRFDIDKVEYAIQELSNYEFHFTGNLRNLEIKRRLDQYKNVKFLPSVEPNDVPALLATYDVGIIPYTINEYNKNIYPLKINEYFAVGVPVVMTAFADLKDFDGMVSVANDKEDFKLYLVSEIENDSKEKILERKNFSEKNSWDQKAIEFGEILENSIQ